MTSWGRYFLVGLVLFSFKANALVYGEDASENNFPGIVRLYLFSSIVPKNIQDVRTRMDDVVSSCTGILITNELVLTAGHCASHINDGTFVAVQGDQVSKVTSYYSEYQDEYQEIRLEESTVNENFKCSKEPEGIVETISPDLAVLKLASPMDAPLANFNFDYSPKIEDTFLIAGYGTQSDPYSTYQSNSVQFLPLKQGQVTLWRTNEQRIAFKNKDQSPFAADGDSGGPIMVNGQAVAVISTLQRNCETPFGNDFGYINTAFLLSTEQAKTFISRALKLL